jgi:hypothetical protein
MFCCRRAVGKAAGASTRHTATTAVSAAAALEPMTVAEKAKVVGVNALLAAFVKVTGRFDTVLRDMKVTRVRGRTDTVLHCTAVP